MAWNDYLNYIRHNAAFTLKPCTVLAHLYQLFSLYIKCILCIVNMVNIRHAYLDCQLNHYLQEIVHETNSTEYLFCFIA